AATRPCLVVGHEKRIVEVPRTDGQAETPTPDRLAALELVQCDGHPGLVETGQRALDSGLPDPPRDAARLDSDGAQQHPVRAGRVLIDAMPENVQKRLFWGP